MLRYAITNLTAHPLRPGLSPEDTRRLAWLQLLDYWIKDGVDFIQLREPRLDASELFALAVEGMRLLQQAPQNPLRQRPRLLVNTRADVALASHADGVHLTSRSGELTPHQIRALFRSAGRTACLVSKSCHTVQETHAVAAEGADLALFGPVFGKFLDGLPVTEPTGLSQLHSACTAAAPMPVLALGSVTTGNLASCLEAGAAGIAGIRLFEPAENTKPGTLHEKIKP